MAVLFKVFALFTAALSVSALATPHAARSLNHHHALAARKAIPEPVPAAEPAGSNFSQNVKVVKPKKLRRRSNSSRCSVKSSSASASASSTVAASSSSKATPTAAAAAVEGKASSSTQSTEKTSSSKTTPTTTTHAAETTSSSSSSTKKATSTSSSETSTSTSVFTGNQSGQGTFYETGLGACGITNTDSDKIAAVSHLLFDSYPNYDGTNPNSNPVCGKTVTASYQGKSVTVTITDRCTGCAETDLDFSPSAFTELADESLGRIDITWVWD